MFTVKELAELQDNVSEATINNKLKRYNLRVKNIHGRNPNNGFLIDMLKDDLKVSICSDDFGYIDYINLLMDQLNYERDYNQEELSIKNKEIKMLNDLLIECNKKIESNTTFLRKRKYFEFLNFKVKIEYVIIG